jgi:peptidyl-prolyl cis-trans isomerase SurA
MYFRLIIFISLVILNFESMAQTNPVLFSIDGNGIRLDEFTKAFSKNNQQNITENKKITRDFLNKYIGYKLKVAEAYKLNLHRGERFKELTSVFKHNLILANVFDKNLMAMMVDEVYQHMKTEIKVRHLLIKVHRYADPKDTLIAYQKALDIRKSIKSGKNFNELATEVSDAPSAAADGGEMGYIKALKLPYNIENYIYSTNSDDYSLPLRSNEGYHIVKIIDRRPAPGYFSVKHILITPKDTSQASKREAENKIREIYSKLVSGENFEDLAKTYSNDITCGLRGNALPWFGTGFMPDNFEKECIDLQNGQFSKPIETRFGWHIIKKVAQKEVPLLNKVHEQVEKEVIHCDRGKVALREAINRLKKDYKFTDFQTLSEVWNNVDSTIFEAKWAPDEYFDLPGKLFEFNNRAYFQKDFVNYLKNNQQVTFPIPLKNYVYLRYKEFVDEIILAFEMEQIEKKNSEVANQLKEYEETVLMNLITEQEILTKLSFDKQAVKSYYEKNKEKYNKNYQAHVTIFKFSEELKKIEKQFKKLKKNNASDKEIVARIKANTDITFDMAEKGVKEEGEDELVDKIIARYKIGEVKSDDKMYVFEEAKRIIWLDSQIEKTNKSIEKIEEKVANDYKASFESNWMKHLKRKYSVEINENVFESIFNN